MHVLYEMLEFCTVIDPCDAPYVCTVPVCFMHVPPRLPCRRPVGTRYPGSPHLLLHVPYVHTFFCTDISTSCRITEMLPWHHFRFTAVAPLSFRHGDKCLVSCSCQHFHKNCIKLAYVIRIMITTIKMFKIVVCFRLLNNMGIFRNCCLLFPASFKLA